MRSEAKLCEQRLKLPAAAAMLFALCVLAFGQFVPLKAAEPDVGEAEHPWRWAAPQIQTTVHYNDLEAKLSLLDERQYTAGELIEVQALIECTAGLWTLHDPFLAKSGMSTQLVVFVGRNVYAIIEPEKRDVPLQPLSLHSGTGTGTIFSLRSDRQPTNTLLHEPTALSECVLGPGRYQLQLLVGRGVATEDKGIVTRVAGVHPSDKPRKIRASTDVLLRSNVVTFEIREELERTRIVENRPVETSGLAVRLAAKSERVRFGECVELQITLRNVGEQFQVIRDPFLTETGPTSLQLRVSTPQGAVLGNLIGSNFSGHGPGAGPLVSLPPGGVLMRCRGFPTGAMDEHRELQIGQYRLQCVLRQNALVWHPGSPNDPRIPLDIRKLTPEERWQRWAKTLTGRNPDASISPAIPLDIIRKENEPRTD